MGTVVVTGERFMGGLVIEMQLKQLNCWQRDFSRQLLAYRMKKSDRQDWHVNSSRPLFNYSIRHSDNLYCKESRLNSNKFMSIIHKIVAQITIKKLELFKGYPSCHLSPSVP